MFLTLTLFRSIGVAFSPLKRFSSFVDHEADGINAVQVFTIPIKRLIDHISLGSDLKKLMSSLRYSLLQIDNSNNLVVLYRFLNKLEPWQIAYIMQQ